MLFRVAETNQTVSFSPRTLVIAGFTGRDESAVDSHIRELVDEGIQAPESVPAFYLLAPDLLTHATHIEVPTSETSAEVEPVLLCSPEGWYVAVGSDHTARDLERVDIGESKKACPKPVSTEVWPYEEVRRQWDQITARSWAHVDGEEVLYQEASLRELLPVPEVVRAMEEKTREEADGAAVFLGTVSLRTNGFVFADRYRVELHDPTSGRHLSYTYWTERTEETAK
jgi:hypothetical protein